MVEISVVLPTYNREETLPRAIESVLSQTVDDIELIVVDDHSQDETQEIISQYSEQIRYIRHDENKGAPAARNTGIRASRGEFIAFIDSDDRWKSDKLEKQRSIFRSSNSSVGAVYTGYIQKSENCSEIGAIPSKRGDIFEMQLMKDWVNPTSTVMIRAECFDEVGLFDTELEARQDYDMWIRIARQYEFEYIRELLVVIHTGSSERITDNLDARLRAHQKLLQKIKDDISSLDLRRRRRAWCIQYYTMGRYAQKMGQRPLAKQLFVKSITFYPLYWKSFIAILLCLSGIDTKNQYLIMAKNIHRKMFQ